MNYFEHVLNIWDALYDKSQNTKDAIEKYFHDDYTQCINGVVMNRLEYIDHVSEQKKHIESMKFECQKYLAQSDQIFMLYNAKGRNTQGEDIEAEVISYFEFKDKKIVQIHGQVRLIKGIPSDVDM